MKVILLKIIFSIHAIAIISFAQLFGTSLWFSANSVVLDLIREWNISVADIGWLTNALQIGFILGTFLLHLLGLLTDSKQVQFCNRWLVWGFL